MRKPPVAALAILALLIMLNLCVAEDAEQDVTEVKLEGNGDHRGPHDYNYRGHPDYDHPYGEYKPRDGPDSHYDHRSDYQPDYEPGYHRPHHRGAHYHHHKHDYQPSNTSCPPTQPPPEAPYCCAKSCPTPVPKPPSFEQLPAVPANGGRKFPAADGSPAQLEALRRIIAKSKPVDIYPTRSPKSTKTTPPVNQKSPKKSLPPNDKGFCSLGPRVPVTLPGPPPAQGAVKLFITQQVAALPAGCGWTLDTSQPRLSACSGNTLSTGLILAAAHCFDSNNVRLGLRGRLEAEGYPTDINDDPCGINTIGVQLQSVMACYDFDQTTNQNSFDTSKCLPGRTYMANGVSWYPRPKLTDAVPPTLGDANELIVTAPYDHAIIFTATPINHLPPAAFYKYNYRNNYPDTTPINVENWSYIGFCSPGAVDGLDPPCPNPPGVACPLSHVGPSTYMSETLGNYGPGPDAVNTPITSFPGNSGSCLLNSPDQCCYAVSSFGITVCQPDCLDSSFSPIMAERPLSALWASRQVVLTAP